jgi:hypothetical protein
MNVRNAEITAKTYTAKSKAGNITIHKVTKEKKHELLSNDLVEQFDTQKTLKESNIKRVRIDMLTQQLQVMKELNHYLRTLLNFIVGVKL